MDKIVRTEDETGLLRHLGSTIALVETDAMRKHASSDAMGREMLLQHKPDKDHFLMHVIALGDGEQYSFNRNADFFPKKANREYHETFVKNAHFFREHNNDDPSKKIGDVKASIHNDNMSRVELAVWGHKKKASDVYDRIRSGENVSLSMSCTVPFDVDSCTGKKASSPREYEPHMKRSPGQYIPEFKKYAYVINTEPRFFDISYVARPADRIAHYLDYFLDGDGSSGSFAKAASSGGTVPSALWAEAGGISAPRRMFEKSGFDGSAKHAVLEKLASVENEYNDALYGRSDPGYVRFVKEAARWSFDPRDELSEDELSAARKLQPGTFFGEMAKRGSFLPYYSFLAYALNDTAENMKKDAAAVLGSGMLPGLFSSMMRGPVMCCDDESLFDPHAEDFMSRLDPGNDDIVQKFMNRAEDRFSVKSGPASGRAIHIRISLAPVSGDDPNCADKKDGKSGDAEYRAVKEDVEREHKENEKNASADTLDRARRYAHLYGLYKVSAVENMMKRQNNTLDKQTLTRVVSQNNIQTKI